MKKQRGQGIIRVSDLFKKYTNLLKAPQGTIVNTFIDVVYELLGVRIEKEHCTYTVSSKTLTTRLPGMIKSEIKIQKKEILKRMSEKLGAKSAPIEIL